MDEERAPIIRTRRKRNVTTGKPTAEEIVLKIDPNAHLVSIDQLPPPGFKPGELRKDHPKAGIDLSQPKGDRD